MHRVVLVEVLHFLDLAHHDDDGRGASKEGIAGPLVSLPGIDEVRDALLEELAVDLDRVGHGDDLSGGYRAGVGNR